MFIDDNCSWNYIFDSVVTARKNRIEYPKWGAYGFFCIGDMYLLQTRDLVDIPIVLCVLRMFIILYCIILPYTSYTEYNNIIVWIAE